MRETATLERTPAVKTDAVQKTIATARIDADPGQPRKLFDQTALQELANSMRELGQLQAITVRYNPSTRRYTIVMGERRWRAAKLAGIDTMYALVLRDVDDEEAFIKAVAENVGRVDMTPLEEAEAFKRLTEAGWTIEQIASKCGRATDGVGYRLDLLNLIPAAREALAKTHLPLGLAWYVAKLDPSTQSVFLGKWGRGEFANFRDAEAFAQACRIRAAAEQQGLFGMEEPSVEEKQVIAATRQRVVSKVDQLARAGEILHELSQMEPEVLAKALAGVHGGVAGYQARVSHLQGLASKVAGVLRRAKAIAAVSTMEFSETSVA